jgi:CMP-2-keto-3-deoxyoctulosonic acid synthetase
MYGYRKETLLQFTKLDQTENEAKFNLEQLRALDNGIPIKVVLTDYPYRGIDTEEDLNQFESNQ